MSAIAGFVDGDKDFCFEEGEKFMFTYVIRDRELKRNVHFSLENDEKEFNHE